MSPGSLIVSIDCEGLWGVSDKTNQYRGVITTDSLGWAYHSLLDLLNQVNLPATFAFVSLFATEEDQSREEVAALMDQETHRDWLSAAHRALQLGETSGWLLPESLEWVKSAGVHEIASHSYTHLPLHETLQPVVAAEVENAGVERWSTNLGIHIDTYVFPRNQVVETRGSMPAAVLGYRASRPSGGKVRRTLGELNVLQKSQDPLQDSVMSPNYPVAIPSGFICNVRRGPRRHVPASVTRARWRHICRHAASTGGVAHLWLHPHNLIIGHRQLDLLTRMLQDSRNLVQSADLVPMTQLDFVRSQVPTLGGA